MPKPKVSLISVAPLLFCVAMLFVVRTPICSLECTQAQNLIIVASLLFRDAMVCVVCMPTVLGALKRNSGAHDLSTMRARSSSSRMIRRHRSLMASSSLGGIGGTQGMLVGAFIALINRSFTAALTACGVEKVGGVVVTW